MCDANVLVKAKMDSDEVLRMMGDQTCPKGFDATQSQCDEIAGATPVTGQDRQLVLSEHAVKMLKISEIFFKEKP